MRDSTAGVLATCTGGHTVRFSLWLNLGSLVISAGLQMTLSVARGTPPEELAILERAQQIRRLVLCSELKRTEEKGPRDGKDLNDVRAAAEAGTTGCQMILGAWYERGEGVPQDPAAAMKWFERASENSAAGFVGMGRLHERGLGVPQSPEKAAVLYRQAAQANDANGMVAWGRMLENGAGVAQDLRAAADQYRNAAFRQDDEAWTRLEELHARHRVLSPEDISTLRTRWFRVLSTRFGLQVQEAKFRRGAIELKAEIQMTFLRGARSPKVKVIVPSGDETFDKALIVELEKLKLPPAPVFDDPAGEMKLQAPVTYRPDPGEPRK